MPEKPIQWTPQALLKPKRQADLVEVPSRLVLTLSGSGDPNDPAFAEGVGALYGLSYALRFGRKKAGLPVFKVGVLEGEWWAEGEHLPVHAVPSRAAWRWRLRMGIPDDVEESELAEVVESVTNKRGGKLEGSESARGVELCGLPAQRMARILHVGPYETEPASFAQIETLLEAEGLRRTRGHVEVYLSDPGRTAPEKLKTTLLTQVVS